MLPLRDTITINTAGARLYYGDERLGTLSDGQDRDVESSQKHRQRPTTRQIDLE